VGSKATPDLSVIDYFAGAPKLCGKILQFGQSVPNRQDRFSIVHMNTWDKCKGGDRCCKHVYQTKRGMVSHQMAAAFCTELTLAKLSFLKRRDVLSSFGDLHGLRLP
jgi:hypothetical protein